MVEDTFYTLVPLNRVLRIFTLSNVKREKTNLIRSWSLTKNLIALSIMTIMNVFLLFLKIRGFQASLKSESLKFIDSLQLTYLFGFTEYILDIILVHRMRQTTVKYFQCYNSIDKMLGTPDFKAMRSQNFVVIVGLIISYSLLSLLDYGSWIMAGYNWELVTLYSNDYIHNFINALTALDLVSNVIQIEYRLKVMIHILEEFHMSSATQSYSLEDSWVEPVVDEMKVNRLKTVCDHNHLGIIIMSKCYVRLCDQVNYINRAYGIRIAAFCLILLINLTYLANIFLRLIFGLLVPPNAVYTKLPAVATALRILNYGAVLLIVVHRCQQTYTQCDNIIRLVDLTLVNKKIPAELQTALIELRGLVVSRPVQFHGQHFFNLDNSLLVSVASVVFTYTIILLQSMS